MGTRRPAPLDRCPSSFTSEDFIGGLHGRTSTLQKMESRAIPAPDVKLSKEQQEQARKREEGGGGPLCVPTSWPSAGGSGLSCMSKVEDNFREESLCTENRHGMI